MAKGQVAGPKRAFATSLSHDLSFFDSLKMSSGEMAKFVCNGCPERLSQALAEDLHVIHPNGKSSTKAEAVRAFSTAYAEKPPEYLLEIGRVETRVLGEGLCLATYDEWHRSEPGRARVATAVLRKRADGKGIECLFLQETYAPHLEQ